MAYILGWFFSDGNVSKEGNQISIHLHIKDHYILEKIRKIMKSERPIDIYARSSYLRINSKILGKDLIKLGCIPRKSLTLNFPFIQDKFLSHFVRGYFEGDGSIHFNKPNTIKITFIGTKQFLEELQERLYKLLGLKKHPIKQDRTFWVFEYYGDNARRLCKWMYKNAKNLYLERKKDRFDRHMRLRNGKI